MGMKCKLDLNDHIFTVSQGEEGLGCLKRYIEITIYKAYNRPQMEYNCTVEQAPPRWLSDFQTESRTSFPNYRDHNELRSCVSLFNTFPRSTRQANAFDEFSFLLCVLTIFETLFLTLLLNRGTNSLVGHP